MAGIADPGYKRYPAGPRSRVHESVASCLMRRSAWARGVGLPRRSAAPRRENPTHDEPKAVVFLYCMFRRSGGTPAAEKSAFHFPAWCGLGSRGWKPRPRRLVVCRSRVRANAAGTPRGLMNEEIRKAGTSGFAHEANEGDKATSFASLPFVKSFRYRCCWRRAS